MWALSYLKFSGREVILGNTKTENWKHTGEFRSCFHSAVLLSVGGREICFPALQSCKSLVWCLSWYVHSHCVANLELEFSEFCSLWSVLKPGFIALFRKYRVWEQGPEAGVSYRVLSSALITCSSPKGDWNAVNGYNSLKMPGVGDVLWSVVLVLFSVFCWFFEGWGRLLWNITSA